MTVTVDGICLSEADVERVGRKTDQHGPVFKRLGRCHMWDGKPNLSGYGVIMFRRDGKSILRRAHRVVWALSGRALTPGLVLDHLCPRKLCVNPCHLEEVDPQENIRRGSGRWRDTGLVHPNGRKTHCPRGHDYAVEGRVNRAGSRYCLACARIKGEEKRARRRQIFGSPSGRWADHGPSVEAQVHRDPRM